jgi:arylsulfatase A-like enzyme
MQEKLNIIMITLDGLRRDKLDLCDNLSQVIKNSLFFSNMVTASTYTFASMPAIFSGTYPSVNGIDSYYHMYRFKKELYKTLTQYLKDDGYYIVVDVLNDCVLPSQTVDVTVTHKMGDDLSVLHKELIKNISEKKPFFLYLHYTSIHDEYKKLAKQYGDFDDGYFGKEAKIRNQQIYDSLVKKCDLYIKEIMEYIRSLGLDENTRIIFHSDHGTSNGEKVGDRLYGNSLYDYSLKTFFIVYSKSEKPIKLDFQVRTIDIMPTILEFLNIKRMISSRIFKVFHY